jgi:hypothetical protein
MIGASSRKTLSVSIGPPNLDAIDLCTVSKPEMKSHIVVGDITGAASYLLHKPTTSSENCNLGADAIAI